MRLTRRDFLRVTAASTAALALPPLGGCGRASAEVFPLGVGSADPTPSSVILWTRIEPGGAGSVDVQWELATDEDFDHVVVGGTLPVDSTWDYTLRVKVTDLSPGTRYWYRFRARDAESTVGRTRTAPAPGEDVPVRFALASCQDFGGRHYHAWRALLEEKGELDFVVFLGDYIYETIGHLGEGEGGGDPRRAVTIPDGLKLDDPIKGDRAALTLSDYRALYRQYRTDPWLQEVHARWPMVAIWDDHEFANDAWQDHATDFDGRQGDEPSKARREAATRAFFEYVPVDATFDETAGFPDELRLSRAFRWGRHFELWLTDQRTYRSDHVIPEGPADKSVGKLLANSAMGSRTMVLKSGFDPREAAANPTMLGVAQYDWLVAAMRASDATWRLLGSPLMVAEMVLDLTEFDTLPAMFRDRFYFKTDQWDGYRSERRRLLAAVADLPNMVVLSGDLHGFYASHLRPDFDAADAAPTAVEYTVSSISSPTVDEQLRSIIQATPILKELGFAELVDRFDEVVLRTCPWFVHSDSRTTGVAVMEVDRDRELRATFLRTSDARQPAYGGVVERVSFRTPAGRAVIERSR